jgi:hypothetical protein
MVRPMEAPLTLATRACGLARPLVIPHASKVRPISLISRLGAAARHANQQIINRNTKGVE